MRRIAPCATTQYRQPFTPLVATMIISFSPLLKPDSRSSSASWYAKNARNSAGRCAKVRNTFGTKPAFCCTSTILARMSSGSVSSAGTGKRLIGGVAMSTPELQRMQSRIEAAVREQLGVAALLDHAAALEGDDAVGALDRREPVRDHEAGAALHQRLERLLHQALGFRVECRGGLVEDEDRRVLVDRARDREALALAAGELGAVVPDQGVGAERQAVDESAEVR